MSTQWLSSGPVDVVLEADAMIGEGATLMSSNMSKSLHIWSVLETFESVCAVIIRKRPGCKHPKDHHRCWDSVPPWCFGTVNVRWQSALTLDSCHYIGSCWNSRYFEDVNCLYMPSAMEWSKGVGKQCFFQQLLLTMPLGPNSNLCDLVWSCVHMCVFACTLKIGICLLSLQSIHSIHLFRVLNAGQWFGNVDKLQLQSRASRDYKKAARDHTIRDMWNCETISISRSNVLVLLCSSRIGDTTRMFDAWLYDWMILNAI